MEIVMKTGSSSMGAPRAMACRNRDGRTPRIRYFTATDGSVWPHDNALIAYGLSGQKDKALAERILTGLFDASVFFDPHRMPELFCGFPKRPGEAPTLYPVACAPQAWAA